MSGTEKDSGRETVVFVGVETKTYVSRLLDAITKSKDSLFNYEMYMMPAVNNATVKECVKYLKETGKKCLIPARDADTLTTSVVNQQLGYPTPSTTSIVCCNNKNIARTLFSSFGWFYGFNLDQSVDSILEQVKAFPCMLKATMLCGGEASFRCENENALRTNLEIIRSDTLTREMNKSFCSESVSFLQESNELELVNKCTEYMVEEYIETQNTGTYQFCMEAHVTRDGQVILYSLVEELFYENGMMLGHIIPPVHFEGEFAVFESYLESIGKRMYALGFRNQTFDIEFWRLPDGSFRLIEVNPRMAASYYDLYNQYNGSNVFQDVASLVHYEIEPDETPLAHLQKIWCSNKRKHTHSFQIGLVTRAVGKVDDVFDCDYLEKRIAKGLPGFIRYPREYVLSDMSSTRHGVIISNVTLRGSWNEIVEGARTLRERFYKDKSQFYEGQEYPDYFVKDPSLD